MVDVVVLLLLVFSEGNATGKKIVKTGEVVFSFLATIVTSVLKPSNR